MASGSSALGRGRTQDRRRFCFGYLFAGCKLSERHRELSASFASVNCKLDSNLSYTSVRLALAFQIAAFGLDESVRPGRYRSSHFAARFLAKLAGVDYGYFVAVGGV